VEAVIALLPTLAERQIRQIGLRGLHCQDCVQQLWPQLYSGHLRNQSGLQKSHALRLLGQKFVLLVVAEILLS